MPGVSKVRTSPWVRETEPGVVGEPPDSETMGAEYVVPGVNRVMLSKTPDTLMAAGVTGAPPEMFTTGVVKCDP